ncbi:hypothetical protein F5144DRAFT_594244 [Chaetomium tenue]|uniref:Uncharacterized protein n=1 Tax=Chaetomium tenue TaxID=1854479 RepID=A0ACB7P4Q0_9PEZI|nr:hypothetical protein F5144DRAFT_594244 [Chaetomium globosum]
MLLSCVLGIFLLPEIPVIGNGGVGDAADFTNVVTDSKASVETNIDTVQRLIPDPPWDLRFLLVRPESFAALGSAQFDVESKPFNLVLSSDDAKVDGQTLSACHTGAAIEQLCLSGGGSVSSPNPLAPATFRFNSSANTVSPGPAPGAPGVLSYQLPATPPIPSALHFFYDPITNFALPLLQPGYSGQTLSFDAEERLGVQGYVNYKTSPPTSGQTSTYYRWFACFTYFSGYQYQSLVWALGDGAEPETPDCAAVNVTRVFI